ncbi:MAG TPA: hypothetical protein G4N91_04180 [Dehalococcoidia bacterium]|nr:hypothetical protein [Dehalococcoidia bacterium]
MIERVHEHIISELGTNSRTDTIFVLTGIILNLLVLGINSIIALNASDDRAIDATSITVMVVLVALLIVVNLIVELGLVRGRQTRVKLLNSLLKMYKDQGVAKYYDPTLLSDYRTRYNLFMFGVIFIGIVALIIPFVLLVT